ncbi:MAG: hypothetical protein GTO63_35370 [Anaerolineae bacterium]|nr:hypothetical protein [Anaerolineae bacterium]
MFHWTRYTSKELALVSIFSSLWVVSQLHLGTIIGALTHVHGVANRIVGWMLMLLLANMGGRFGMVTLMASVSALATRAIRRSFSLYSLTVGLGYSLGGLVFDALYFGLGTHENLSVKRVILASTVSGLVASAPYALFKLFSLGFFGFIAYVPSLAHSSVRGVIMSLMGSMVGLFVLPRVSGVS